MSTNPGWQTPSWLKTARAGTRLSQLWQVPMFLLGLTALVLVGSGAVVRHGQQCQDFQDQLACLRQALQNDNEDLRQLLPLAESLVEQSSYYSQQAGEAHFLVGSVLLRLAEETTSDQANPLQQQALYHFRQAEAVGVPLRDRPQLWYRLGKTLYQAEGNHKPAIDYIARGLPKGADNPAEGYGLLAKVYLELPVPNVEAALQANEQQIHLTSDETILVPARLLRAELLIKKKQHNDALLVLERVGSNAPDELWHRSLYLRAVCCEAEGLWSKAISLWEELLPYSEAVPGGKKQIYYALGKCYDRTNPPQEQKARQAWQQALQYGGEEGQAAAIHLAEICLLGTQPDYEAAAGYLQQALAQVHEEKDYKNSLVDLEKVRELAEMGIQEAGEAGSHEQAQQFTQIFQKFSPSGTADKKLAEISEGFARALEEQARQAAGDEAAALKQKAQDQWAKAAQAWQKAAQEKTAGGAASGDRLQAQAELLWKSILCYRNAAQEEQALTLLKDFLNRAPSEEAQARAWFHLGESYRFLDRTAEAENAYYKCWEFSDSPFSYRARYQLALMKIEQKDLEQAEATLWVNLKVQGPNLDREAHEKSLYLLAGLLYHRGNYSQAYIWLKEAARRYPDNAEVFAIRDLLGDSYHQLANEKQKKIDDNKSSLPATALSELKRSRLEWLEKSVQTYEQLADDLKMLKERQPLTPKQEKLFRKASFNRADLVFKLENYTEALRHYQFLAELCQGQLEELIAFQRIFMCCTVLKFQPSELNEALQVMQGTLTSAKNTLPLLPEQSFQGGSGTWTRQNFQDLITQAEAILERSAVQVLKTPPP